MEQPLQIPEGGPATFSPDGTKLAYNPISREWRTWKRYSAGRAQDVWTYDLDADTVEQITDFRGTDNWPMWIDDRIYFTSDRTGTLNLWCYDTTGKATRQITDFTDFDVLFPSRGDVGIVFEKGGFLWLMERGSEKVRRLDITLADDEPWTRPVWKDGGSRFGAFSPSPDARDAIVEFRGDLFRVPAKIGEVEDLTDTPSRRERDPAWSPDGARILFVAEHGESYELYTRGLAYGEEVRLTDGTDAWIQSAQWSPDSSTVVCTDNSGRLFTVDVATREQRVLDTAHEDPVQNVQWSRDGRWLCYTKRSPNGYRSVFAARADGSKPPVQLTSDDWDDSWPTFDPEGRYLWFVSSRDYEYGPRERLRDRVYGLLLRDDVENPVGVREAPEAEPAATADSKPKPPAAWDIDVGGIEDREIVLPMPAGSYYRLRGVDGGLLFVAGGDLKRYDLEAREVKTILEGGFDCEFTPDLKKFLYRHDGKLCPAVTQPGQTPGKDPFPTGDIRMRVHPTVEWAQMYGDAWRIMRDFFYDPNMHGVDWDAMRAEVRAAGAAHRPPCGPELPPRRAGR